MKKILYLFTCILSCNVNSKKDQIYCNCNEIKIEFLNLDVQNTCIGFKNILDEENVFHTLKDSSRTMKIDKSIVCINRAKLKKYLNKKNEFIGVFYFNRKTYEYKYLEFKLKDSVVVFK